MLHVCCKMNCLNKDNKDFELFCLSGSICLFFHWAYMLHVGTSAHFSIQFTVKKKRLWMSTAGCYHLADVQPRRVRLPADGPEKAVHFLDCLDLLLIALLLWVFGDECHLQSFVRFTHRLHLRVLPQIHARVLQFFGAICAYEVVKVPQNLQREYGDVFWNFKKYHNLVLMPGFYVFLTPVWRIMRDVLDPRVERMPAISTAI